MMRAKGSLRLWIHAQFRRIKPKRVPYRQQLSAMECGAACLAMILTYFGRATTVAEIRDYCVLGRDGLKAATLARVARSLGLDVKAFAADLDTVGMMPMPAIIHWGFNHFVVLESWSRGRIAIVDPARGRRKITPEEFRKYFTGIALIFNPASETLLKSSPYQPIRLREFAKRSFTLPGIRGVLAQVILGSALLQVLGLAFPGFTGFLIDRVLSTHAWNLLSLAGTAAVVVVVTQTILTYLRSIVLMRLRTQIDDRLMRGFVEHLLFLPYPFFQQRTSGDLLQRLRSNASLREILTNQIISAILDGSFLLGYLIAVFWLLPGFGWTVMLLGALESAVLLLASNKLRYVSQRELNASAEEQSCLMETLKNIPILKVSGGERSTIRRWSNLFTSSLNASLERGHALAAVEAALAALRLGSPVILMWMGASYVMQGRITVGEMVMLQTLAIGFLTPLTTLLNAAQQMQVARAHLERLTDVLQASPETHHATTQLPNRIRGDIELRNVSFRYTEDAPWILRDISLSLTSGEKLAIVGSTGSGKSTLAMILTGVYRPTQGEILMDGIPLHDFDPQVLRSQLGVVLQEPFLFGGSIRENIALNQLSLDLEKVMEMSKLAELHNDILQMPMGYETVISEGGGNLSGGQRQRLAVARALASDARILILDEATSHLDVLTEARLDANLSALACTRIVIAHRLSTIKNAHQIIVLEDGQIVEHGTHEELLRCNGRYVSLTSAQGSTHVSQNTLNTPQALPRCSPQFSI
jgi:ABC-type bacteriocin/lantibiotic exporter with double-glycine peptidase domain